MHIKKILEASDKWLDRRWKIKIWGGETPLFFLPNHPLIELIKVNKIVIEERRNKLNGDDKQLKF